MRLIDANKFQKTLDKACREPDYQHEGETWQEGLSLAGCLLDQEPTVDSFEEQNKKFYDFVGFLGLLMARHYEAADEETYKQAIKDITFDLCAHLEAQGIPINWTPLTEDYIKSNTHKDFLRRGILDENI